MGSLVVLQDWVRIAGNSASAVAVAMPAPWPEVSQHEVLLSLLSLRGVTTTAPDTLTFSLRTVTNDDASDNTVILPGTELWAIGALTSNAFYKKRCMHSMVGRRSRKSDCIGCCRLVAALGLGRWSGVWRRFVSRRISCGFLAYLRRPRRSRVARIPRNFANGRWLICGWLWSKRFRRRHRLTVQPCRRCWIVWRSPRTRNCNLHIRRWLTRWLGAVVS